MVAEGISFTVLAPRQAKAWRPPNGHWRTTPVDPGRAYKCYLPSGKSIDLFFYDGAVAQAVAFERLLVDNGMLSREELDSRLADFESGHRDDVF